MGYTSDGDRNLTSADADANWTALELATMRQEMAESRKQLKQAVDELNQSRWKLRAVEVSLEKTIDRIDPLVEVGPTVLNLAQRVNRVTRFYRGAVDRIKRNLGMHDRRIGKGQEI